MSKELKITNKTNKKIKETISRNSYDECSEIQWIRGCLKGLKRKKHKIKGDWGEPAKNPPMLKLVFS